MNYEEEINEMGYKGEYNEKDAPFIITYLSDKTYTGRNAFWLKKEVKEGKIPLKGISDKANKDLFPDIYMNNLLSTTEVQLLENMRYAELEMILEGKYPNHPKEYAFGYVLSDILGKTYCEKDEHITPGLNYVFTYNEMVEKFRDNVIIYPSTLVNEVKKIAGIGIKIRNFEF